MVPSPDGAPLSIPHWGFTPYPSVLNGTDYYGYLNVFTASSMRQPIKDHGSPRTADKHHGFLNAPADKTPWLTPRASR